MRFQIIYFYLFLLTLQSVHGNIDLESFKQRVKKLFYHGYEGYMRNAYPYDELRPITCDGHDTWGGFSLTLIDSLDTLVTLGNHSEFRRAVDLILNNIDTNRNVNISVFETNIRVVGGLLAAHFLSERAGVNLEPGWPCHGRLLSLAETFARKLLPAFDTPTGMPFGTVNLAQGAVPPSETPVTCVATVGTLILEFGALSRLTGDPRYEAAAIKALRAMWSHRSGLGLVGNHINVLSGNWIGKEATIGSGVDSYFEYLFKGSVLFRLPELDAMFREYRASIKKYLKFGSWHVMATMDGGSVTNNVYQSLESFWPGVLALAGEIEEAKELLIAYHSVWKKFGFLPEMFDVSANKPVGRQGVYPLRPEFIESVMYVYRATKDPYLLEMGADVLTSIERDAKTECGFATIKDVRTHTKENRMESFFLSETVKYLYLLFDEDNFLHRTPLSSDGSAVLINADDQCISGSGYIFNSEAHPLDGGLIHCCSIQRLRESEAIATEDFLPQDLDLNTDLGSFLNTSTNASFTGTVLGELEATFGEIMSQSAERNTGSVDGEIDDVLEGLWKDLSGMALLSNDDASISSGATPSGYIPPNMHKKSAPPLMTCPTVPFHVKLNTMTDMSYRNLN